MNKTRDNHKPEHLPELEGELAKEIRKTLGGPDDGSLIPEETDQAIRTMIAGRSVEIRRVLSRRKRRLWGSLTAAAAILIAVGAWMLPPPRNMPGDIDRSGSVDIIDAYLLARNLETNTEPVPAADINGDGRVNQADLSALTTRIVSISGDSR
jgi:hypothetical protein